MSLKRREKERKKDEKTHRVLNATMAIVAVPLMSKLTKNNFDFFIVYWSKLIVSPFFFKWQYRQRENFWLVSATNWTEKKVFDDKILTLDFFHRRKWIILVFLCGNDRLISGSKIVAFLWYFYSHAYLVEIRFVQKKKYLIDVRFVINDWNKAFNLFIKSFKLMCSPKSKWWHLDSLAYMKIYWCAILAVADVFRYGSIRKHEFRYFVCDRTECDSDVIERGK